MGQLIEIRQFLCYNLFMTVHVKSYAKVNLTLTVTGKEGGYHTLDSLVTTIDMFDRISLSKRRDKRITVEMHGRESESLPFDINNAAIAAERYVERFDTCGADIVVYKNIPMGAGLGGSSADAAGVLRGMSKLYGAGSERELKVLADSLGSDSGYLLSGGTARMTGRGDLVEHIDFKGLLHLLILVPKGGISTAECFNKFDELGGASEHTTDGAIEALKRGDLVALGKCMNNDLYPAAAALNPDVETACRELLGFSPLGVTVTGSGSAVFALFENEHFCRWAKSRYRGKFECIHVKSVNF